MHTSLVPLVGDLGTPELLLILLVCVLLFGAKKLPELARGSGRALRIFKAETQGLMTDDEGSGAKTADAGARAAETRTADLAARQAELDAAQMALDAERRRLQGS